MRNQTWATFICGSEVDQVHMLCGHATWKKMVRWSTSSHLVIVSITEWEQCGRTEAKTETIFSGSKGKLEIYFMFWECIQAKLGGDAFSLETDLAYLQLWMWIVKIDPSLNQKKSKLCKEVCNVNIALLHTVSLQCMFFSQVACWNICRWQIRCIINPRANVDEQ